MILPQRYIFGGLAKTTAALAFIVVGVVCIGRSLVFMDYIVNHGLSVAVYLYLMLLTMPMMLMGLLPIAAFASVMFIYSKLSLDNELVVLRAAGMSIAAIARPAIIMSFATMAVCFSMSAYFVPLSFAEFKDIEFFVRHRMGSMLVKEGEFRQLGAKVTIYVRDRARNGIMTGVLVQNDRDPARSQTAIAEYATMAPDGDVYKVMLAQGNIQEYDRRTGKVSVVYFDQYVLEIDTTELYPGRTRERGIAERGMLELLNPPTSTPRDRELLGKALSEGHQRIAFPILCLTYTAVALAALLAGPHSRRGVHGRMVAACCAVAAIQGAGLLLANAASLAPALLPAIHLNAVLPGLFCVFLLARHDRRLPRDRMHPWMRRSPAPDATGSRGAA